MTIHTVLMLLLLHHTISLWHINEYKSSIKNYEINIWDKYLKTRYTFLESIPYKRVYKTKECGDNELLENNVFLVATSMVLRAHN